MQIFDTSSTSTWDFSFTMILKIFLGLKSQKFHPQLSQYLYEHREDEKVLRKLILTENQYRIGSCISVKDQEKNRWNILFRALWKQGEIYMHNISGSTWQQLQFRAYHQRCQHHLSHSWNFLGILGTSRESRELLGNFDR
jgi:hypothetical protein